MSVTSAQLLMVFTGDPRYAIDPSHKSNNAFVKYLTINDFVTEIRTCVYIYTTQWCIMGCRTGTLWDLWNRFIDVFITASVWKWVVIGCFSIWRRREIYSSLRYENSYLNVIFIYKEEVNIKLDIEMKYKAIGCNYPYSTAVQLNHRLGYGADE